MKKTDPVFNLLAYNVFETVIIGRKSKFISYDELIETMLGYGGKFSRSQTYWSGSSSTDEELPRSVAFLLMFSYLKSIVSLFNLRFCIILKQGLQNLFPFRLVCTIGETSLCNV